MPELRKQWRELCAQNEMVCSTNAQNVVDREGRVEGMVNDETESSE